MQGQYYRLIFLADHKKITYLVWSASPQCDEAIDKILADNPALSRCDSIAIYPAD